MPYRRKPKGFSSLLPPRFRKEDYADRIDENARLLVMAAVMLYDDNTCPLFKDTEYRDFVIVEILHGDQWRRNKTLHTLEDAKTHVREVYLSHRVKYEARIEAAAVDDGIDRRMVQKDDSRTVERKGVNFQILGDRI